MEALLTDAQAALDLATTQYLNACIALNTSLSAAAGHANRSHIDKLIESCLDFMDSIRQRLSGAMQLLSKTRNRYTIINWIPPELLIKIIYLDTDAYRSTLRLKTWSQGSVSRTISLSSVCSHWRKLILGTSSFWSHIPVHLSEDLVATCVERAQNRPLDIVGLNTGDEIKFESKSPWKGRSALGDHVYNVGSLHLTACSVNPINSMLGWLCGSVTPPYLQEISVIYTGDRWPGLDLSHSGVRRQSRATLILHPFTEQLHSLRLVSIHANWLQCTFGNLCLLSLSVPKLKMTEFEHIIATSPMLQVLELKRISLDGQRSNTKPIAPPNLKLLYLSRLPKTTLQDIIDAFHPITCEVNLDVCPSSFGTADGFNDIMQGIPLMHHALHQMPNTTVLGVGYTIGFLREEALSLILGYLPNVVTLRVEGITLAGADLEVIENGLQKFPQIKTIQIRNVGIFHGTDFQSMPRIDVVRRIEISNCCAYEGSWSGRYDIEPGTPFYDWAVKCSPRIVFL